MQAQMANEAAQALVMIPEQIKAIARQQETDTETQFKYFDAVLKAVTDTAEGERQSVIDFASARDQAQALAANRGGSGPTASGNSGGPAGKGGKSKPGATGSGSKKSS